MTPCLTSGLLDAADYAAAMLADMNSIVLEPMHSTPDEGEQSQSDRATRRDEQTSPTSPADDRPDAELLDQPSRPGRALRGPHARLRPAAQPPARHGVVTVPRGPAARRLPVGERNDVELTTPAPTPVRVAQVLHTIDEPGRSINQQTPQVRELQRPGRSQESARQDHEQDRITRNQTGRPGQALLAP
jgi:hypothetical protein